MQCSHILRNLYVLFLSNRLVAKNSQVCYCEMWPSPNRCTLKANLGNICEYDTADLKRLLTLSLLHQNKTFSLLSHSPPYKEFCLHQIPIPYLYLWFGGKSLCPLSSSAVSVSRVLPALSPTIKGHPPAERPCCNWPICNICVIRKGMRRAILSVWSRL